LFASWAVFAVFAAFPAKAGAAGLTYHGGPVIVTAKVVFIFWGPSFAPGGADNSYATTLQAYRGFFGTSSEYNVITQYSGIHTTNLAAGSPDWFDTTLPPLNVTDTRARNEINTYLALHAVDTSTIYELVLPSTSYSSSGTATSCGGPSLAYCTYHASYTAGGSNIKYSVQPYASCSGCQITGWTAVQNQELFVGDSTIDAVTDPNSNAWYNNISGKEAIELCGNPPVIVPPYVLGYVWSNAANACVL
jgi:hypothetical protein